jgi:hypothetical protein
MDGAVAGRVTLSRIAIEAVALGVGLSMVTYRQTT